MGFISPLKGFELQKCPTSGAIFQFFIELCKDTALIHLLMMVSVHCQLSWWMLKEFQFHSSCQIHLFCSRPEEHLDLYSIFHCWSPLLGPFPSIFLKFSFLLVFMSVLLHPFFFFFFLFLVLLDQSDYLLKLKPFDSILLCILVIWKYHLLLRNTCLTLHSIIWKCVFYISLGKFFQIQHGQRLSPNLSPKTDWLSGLNGAWYVTELKLKIFIMIG